MTPGNQYPQEVIDQLERNFLPPGAGPEDILELTVSVDDSNLRVRGFSAFLGFIDRAYGRLSPRGIRSYAQKHEEQLTISRVQPGSLEMLLEALAQNKEALTGLVILGMALKYLPAVFESLASAYRDYEEARYTRERRRQLMKQIEADEQAKALEKRQKEQLAELLDRLYAAERDNLRAAGEFAAQNLRQVRLRFTGRQEG
jgi:hypothetical protein